ncbi:MAG: hypothetical protein LRY38_00925 [Aeromonadaceae bacterium]|nr:hypothetical protein [Aeromonadaceae bacterium]
MELDSVRQQLQSTCQHIGGHFQLEESEGEWHALIIQGNHWWHLLIADLDLLRHQLDGISRHGLH